LVGRNPAGQTSAIIFVTTGQCFGLGNGDDIRYYALWVLKKVALEAQNTFDYRNILKTVNNALNKENK
jgi:hypothetical protein